MPPIVSPTRKRNALWPLRRSAKGWKTGTLAKRYEAAVHHLLRTKIGSILWAPSYGTRLDQFRTQSVTDTDQTLLAGEIASSFRIWIPDITMLSVDFDNNPYSETLEVTVVWGVLDASNVGTRAAQPRWAFGPVNQTVTI